MLKKLVCLNKKNKLPFLMNLTTNLLFTTFIIDLLSIARDKNS